MDTRDTNELTVAASLNMELVRSITGINFKTSDDSFKEAEEDNIRYHRWDHRPNDHGISLDFNTPKDITPSTIFFGFYEDNWRLAVIQDSGSIYRAPHFSEVHWFLNQIERFFPSNSPYAAYVRILADYIDLESTSRLTTIQRQRLDLLNANKEEAAIKNAQAKRRKLQEKGYYNN